MSQESLEMDIQKMQLMFFMLYISVYTHVEYMYLCYGAQNVTLKPGLMAME